VKLWLNRDIAKTGHINVYDFVIGNWIGYVNIQFIVQ
jgi:hypothetical protein